MKHLTSFLFSPRLMAILLALFAISIAVATFIENDFGSASAKTLVYHAHWFEFILLLGIVNLAGNIILKKLYRKAKFTIFIFHLAFILILAGAAITHFTGFEGTLSIREGEESGAVLTERTYIGLTATIDDSTLQAEIPVSFSALGKNRFNKTIRFGDKLFQLTCKSFIPNAIRDIEYKSQGIPVAELIYTEQNSRQSLIIMSGETKTLGVLKIAFNPQVNDSGMVILSSSGDSLLFTAPFPVSLTSMADQSYSLLEKNIPHTMQLRQLYTFRDRMLVLSKYFSSGKVVARSIPSEEGQTYDALQMEVSSDQDTREFFILGKVGLAGIPETINLNNVNLSINYGSAYKILPFKLKLNEFVVERYPGSQSPSWFESSVTLLDEQRNMAESRRIYMNNILKYRGYRFYQSSYDPDEKGTVLSVNRDWAGTMVTYAGYFLMALGMALSLFNSSSRFRTLAIETALLKNAKRGVVVFLLMFMLHNSAWTQASSSNTLPPAIHPKHAEQFGRMLIQDNAGRIKPVNTLSSEVLRKLYRKTEYKGLNPDQVLIGMFADPAAWQYEPVIRTPHPEIQEILGSKGEYYPFAAFFKDNTYILHEYVEQAFRKKPAFRSKFDNEVIRLDERVNIAYMIFTGEFLRLLPVPGDSSQTWYSHHGVQGKIMTEDSLFVENVISLYIQDVHQSLKSGNWKSPDDIINAISAYQSRCTPDIIPSPRKVSLEIFMNKTDIFSRISNYYGLTGFLLLLLQFIGLFNTKLKLKIPVIISIILIISLFIIHTVGLGFRWYVSGHAPWSNGYEALTYIAWATVLAGLLFASGSSITLSTTSILAYLILHTAHLSWMDPQITNLVPVLRSYWLVIHVATITASYGFLALGALLAFNNLVLMILMNRRSYQFINLTLQELTNIIEMTLIAGLYLLTIGTFLGGVWANESWGRYWGWDPKETWALVTILVYAFIVHMRMVPGLRGIFPLNLASLLGIGTVIMTYFGVNYYLSGLHSYAKGDPLPVPSFVYYTLMVIVLVSVMAFFNYRRLENRSSA